MIQKTCISLFFLAIAISLYSCISETTSDLKKNKAELILLKNLTTLNKQKEHIVAQCSCLECGKPAWCYTKDSTKELDKMITKLKDSLGIGQRRFQDLNLTQ